MLMNQAVNAMFYTLVVTREWSDSQDAVPTTNELVSFFLRKLNEQKTQVVQKSNVLEVMQPVDMATVGGLRYLKDWVAEQALTFDPDAQDFGVDRAKGCILIGPPGGGKSLAAKAVGSVMQLPVIKFNVSRLYRGVVGSTESTTASALSQIASMAPCVVFLDEVDKAFAVRQGGGDGGISQRVLGAVLTFLEESPAPVFWVMSANRAEALPPELVRAGRLDARWGIMPPSHVERCEIVRIHLAKRKHELPDSEVEALAASSAGYMPSELEAAIKAAVLARFGRTKDGDDAPLTSENVLHELRRTTPLRESYAEDFEAMADWASRHARLASEPDPVVLADPPPVEPRRRSMRRELMG
jgi:SpoVK/Ycf46/Vps4 family AAA+-type ATPase